MAATLFSASLSPSFLHLASARPAPSVPSRPAPPLRAVSSALLAARRRWPFLAPVAVAVSSEFETEGAEQEEEEGGGLGSEEEAEAEFSEDLKLFVGNLPFSVDSAQLAGLFEQAGSVEMVEEVDIHGVLYPIPSGRAGGQNQSHPPRTCSSPPPPLRPGEPTNSPHVAGRRRRPACMEGLTASEVAGFGVGALLLCATIAAPRVDGFIASSQRRSLGMCKRCGDLRIVACSQCKGVGSVRKGGILTLGVLDGIYESLGAETKAANLVACTKCRSRGRLPCPECSKVI